MTSRRVGWALPVLGVLFGYAIGYPLTGLLVEGFRSSSGGWTLDHYLGLILPSNAAAWEAVSNSILVSLSSVAGSALLGGGLAYAVTQFDFPGRTLLSRIATLPIALPPLVGVVSFMFISGESGFLPRFLATIVGSRAVPLYLDGITAIIAVHTYSFSVYYFLFLADSLRTLDQSQLDAAASLGSGTVRILTRVVLPHTGPAIAGASILAFMSSMASFSAPLIFGGSHRFMTTQIYTAKLNGDVQSAAAMSAALAAVSVGFFLLLKARSRPSARSKGAVRRGYVAHRPWTRRIILAFAFATGVLLSLPIMTILVLSLVREGSWTWQTWPEEFTLQNFTRLLVEPDFGVPFLNSMVMSMLALAFCLPPSLLAAMVMVKGGLRKVRSLMDALFSIPFAIPGTVVAMALILSFDEKTLLSPVVLVGTFWILPIAYAIRMYPLVLRSSVSGLDGVDDSLIEAAAAAGAGPWRRFRSVLAPLIAPSVVSGSVLVLIGSVGEFVSSILLYAHTSRPVSVEVLAQLRAYNFGGAAALCVLLLAVILGLLWLADRVRGPEKGDPRESLSG